MPRFLDKNGARNAPDLILKRRFFSEQSVTKRWFLLTFCYLGGTRIKSGVCSLFAVRSLYLFLAKSRRLSSKRI